MPVITFGKEHLDEGFMFLARRGEVGCLPDDEFVVTDTLLDLLVESDIPFTRMEKPRSAEQGANRASDTKQRKTDSKVSV